MQKFIIEAHKTLNINTPVFKKTINPVYSLINATTPGNISKQMIKEYITHIYPIYNTGKVICKECKSIFFIGGRGDLQEELKRRKNNINSDIYKHIISTGHTINKEIIKIRNIEGVDYTLQQNILAHIYEGKNPCGNTDPTNQLPGYIRSLINHIKNIKTHSNN